MIFNNNQKGGVDKSKLSINFNCKIYFLLIQLGITAFYYSPYLLFATD